MDRFRTSHTPGRVCLLLFALSLFFSPALRADNAKLTGRVVDAETREPLAGVNVVITHAIVGEGREVAMTPPLGAVTDPDGYYFIMNVRPGTYVVKASLIGYTTVIERPVRVESDRTITLGFGLKQGAVAMDVVEVTGRREIIKADVSSTQEVVSTTRLEQMPVLRVDEFVNKLKGVQLVSGADGYGLSVRGGSIRETDIRMDGMSLQDPRSENAYLGLNSTTIEEIQVLTGGFEAKYGGIRSGLLNVVTKEGHRDRYTMSVKADVAPAHQQRFFGANPWGTDSWVYRVYAGEYAMKGVTAKDSLVPAEFRDFKGWAARGLLQPQSIRFLDSLQRLDLWKRQHPVRDVASRPDIFVEGSITGPFPGAGIPLIGDFAERTTFLLGVKYEDSQLAFPLGPRDNYLDWNTQLKLTTTISDKVRLSANGLFAKVSTVSGGQTTSYGGALVDATSSFNFLNTTDASTRQQARLMASDNIWQMYNQSRLQFFDQEYFVGGLRLTHTLSDRAFYTVDLQGGYTNQQLQPFSLDTSRADAWLTYVGVDGKTYRFVNAALGSPNASTNFGFDALKKFYTYGGLQRVDSSSSWVLQMKGDMTMQLGRHNQLEAGFSVRYQHLFVYTGTWLQAELMYTPDLWDYYTATPIDGGLYVQDKLEFSGMVLNAGLRLDYFNPMKKGFVVANPPDEDYAAFYNNVYQLLPGDWGSYERWLELRGMLANPPGWPEEANRVQVALSPRAGVSFPITESSKMYFNYGHFYQRPATSFLYNQVIDLAGVTVPTPDLSFARTVSYEFGYEQMFFSDFLLNATAYYKDVRNEPLSRRYYNYYHDNIVTKYFPDAYGDVRGIELRFEKPHGRFVTFHAMYDYMVSSYGQSGVANVYENPLEAAGALRTANLTTVDPRPRANADLNLHTPSDFGPALLGVRWFNNIYATLFFEWQSGGQILWNPEQADPKLRIYVPRVDYWNMDLRASKAFDLAFGDVEFVVTIKNLTNNKFLIPENMTKAQLDAYKSSLKLPFQGGSDKWGQWESSDNHIKVGWLEAPIFLNPRRVILGMRVNF